MSLQIFAHTSTRLRGVPNELDSSRFGHLYRVTMGPLSGTSDREGRRRRTRPRRA